MMNFLLQTKNCVSKREIVYQKTRKLVLKMMNFAASVRDVRGSQAVVAGAAAGATQQAQGAWVEKYSSKYQRAYWVSGATGQSVWDRPAGVAAAPAPAPAPAPSPSPAAAAAPAPAPAPDINQAKTQWVEKYSAKYQRPYWVNSTTGQSVWDRPAGGANTAILQSSVKAPQPQPEPEPEQREALAEEASSRAKVRLCSIRSPFRQSLD